MKKTRKAKRRAVRKIKRTVAVARRVTVRQARRKRRIVTPPARKPATVTLTFTAEDLHNMAVALFPCMSMDADRCYLHGILVENDPKDRQGFRFVATDGHRLGVYKRKHMLTGGKPARFSGIIEREAVQYFLKMNPRHFSLFKLEITERNMLVQAYNGTTLIETRRFSLIDGTFPEWERCLPVHTDKPKQAFRANLVWDIAKAVHKLSGATGNSTYPSIALCQNSRSTRGPAWILTDIEGLQYVLMPQTPTSVLPVPPTLDERPASAQLQALNVLLGQVPLPTMELKSQMREVDTIIGKIVAALKSKKKPA